MCTITQSRRNGAAEGGWRRDANHILADQLTLFQSGGGCILCPPHYYFTPRLSDPPTAPLHKAGLGRAGTGRATAQGPWKVDLVLTIAGHLAIA